MSLVPRSRNPALYKWSTLTLTGTLMRKFGLTGMKPYAQGLSIGEWQGSGLKLCVSNFKPGLLATRVGGSRGVGTQHFGNGEESLSWEVGLWSTVIKMWLSCNHGSSMVSMGGLCSLLTPRGGHVGTKHLLTEGGHSLRKLQWIFIHSPILCLLKVNSVLGAGDVMAKGQFPAPMKHMFKWGDWQCANQQTHRISMYD